MAENNLQNYDTGDIVTTSNDVGIEELDNVPEIEASALFIVKQLILLL